MDLIPENSETVSSKSTYEEDALKNPDESSTTLNVNNILSNNNDNDNNDKNNTLNKTRFMKYWMLLSLARTLEVPSSQDRLMIILM